MEDNRVRLYTVCIHNLVRSWSRDFPCYVVCVCYH